MDLCLITCVSWRFFFFLLKDLSGTITLGNVLVVCYSSSHNLSNYSEIPFNHIFKIYVSLFQTKIFSLE